MKAEKKNHWSLSFHPSEVCKSQLTKKNPGFAWIANRIFGFAPCKTGSMEINIYGFIQFLHTATEGFSMAVSVPRKTSGTSCPWVWLWEVAQKGAEDQLPFPMRKNLPCSTIPSSLPASGEDSETRGEIETLTGLGSREKVLLHQHQLIHWRDLMLMPGYRVVAQLSLEQINEVDTATIYCVLLQGTQWHAVLSPLKWQTAHLSTHRRRRLWWHGCITPPRINYELTEMSWDKGDAQQVSTTQLGFAPHSGSGEQHSWLSFFIHRNHRITQIREESWGPSSPTPCHSYLQKHIQGIFIKVCSWLWTITLFHTWDSWVKKPFKFKGIICFRGTFSNQLCEIAVENLHLCLGEHIDFIYHTGCCYQLRNNYLKCYLHHMPYPTEPVVFYNDTIYKLLLW